MQRISGYHFVIHGCNRDNPHGIREAHESEQHAIQCCSDSSNECVDRVNSYMPAPYGCVTKANYSAALDICAGLKNWKGNVFRLCRRDETLNSICCDFNKCPRGDWHLSQGCSIGEICSYDRTEMWIADDIPPQGTHALKTP